MSAQEQMFPWDEPYLPVRREDPMTSVLAAKQLNLKARKLEVLDAMYRMTGFATARQIQQEMARQGIHRERGAVASRLSQLEHDGLVAKVGVRQVPVEEGGTGRAEATWGLL